ncbi:unnamed protein product [Porites evermanni]|uniref:Integrase core domain-containing protein n=1 Tax=Porites evermanni TaxID=104178 RepID=A0ABN8SZ54_9CNID|nr:unnamed protein product [Porites evermanni]
MNQRLRDVHRLVVSRETTRIVLGVLDSEGVSNRRRGRLQRRRYPCKGPNYLWHIDGYDKLKPYGFCIHGAIDGYSRRILWLDVTCTNNDPAIIAQYYVDCVKQLNGAPRIVRADCGTENVIVAGLQRFFRSEATDDFSGDKSFLYGKSSANQRIEAWWSFPRKSHADWWINYFKKIMKIQFSFRACLQFCYTTFLQRELYEVACLWNTHRIRPYPNQDTPAGKPDMLFFLPEITDSQDYKTYVDKDDLQTAEEYFRKECPPFGCQEEFSDLMLLLMEQ